MLSIVLLCLVTLSGSRAEAVRWRTTRTAHFLIHYAAGGDPAARRAADLAEEWHARLSSRMEFTPDNTIPVYLYPDRASFAEATGVRPGERIVGTARTTTVKVDASGLFADVAHVLPHELVHVFLSLQLHDNASTMPLWANEGLAKYLADDWTHDDAELLADAAAGGRIMALDDIATSFPSDEHARGIAYVQSYSIIKYVADNYGHETISVLLKALRRGEPFSTALAYTVDKSAQALEDEWRQYLWEEYSFARWTKLASGLAWTAMGLLAILAYRSRLIRKRRRIEEMEEETGEQ